MAFVVDVLLGKEDIELGMMDRSVLDPLFNLWRRKQRTDELHDGFLEALTHGDPKVRAGGVMFFARMTTPKGDLEPLASALIDHTELYEDVPEPWFGGDDDLRSMLASAVAIRATPEHRAVDALKREAVQPGRAGWVIVGLVGLDPSWVRSNAGTIITNSPTALDPLLFNLNARGIDMANFLTELRDEVSDEVIRAGIRSALAGRAADVEAAVFGP